jgi:hypothetical protein
MKKFLFISRHEPTARQHELAAEKGIKLVHVGDVDAFEGDVYQLFPKWDGPNGWQIGDDVHAAYQKWVAEEKAHGVIVVHPALALRLIPGFMVGVFENANRSAPGEPPKFEAKALHIWADRSHLGGGVAIIEKVDRA